MVQAVVAATVSLLAVALGAWITTRRDERSWRRGHADKWRDIRLERYSTFLQAWREYIVYLQLETVTVTVVQRAQPPGDAMPTLEGDGAAYTQRLDTALSAVELVASSDPVFKAAKTMVQRARDLAAQRATTAPPKLSHESFDRLWAAKREFRRLARNELGFEVSSDGTVD